MDYKIRTASVDDIDSIIGLWQKLAYDQLTKDEYFTEDIDFSGGREQVLNSLTNKSCCIFIAYNQTSVIGFIEVWLQNKDFHFFEDNYAYILHIFVDPLYRSYQITKGLYNKAEEWAISQKSKYLVADVFEFNQKTLKILSFFNLKPYRTRCVKKLSNPS